QFKENRRPTQAELLVAAPDNPVYVQLGYGWSLLTPRALTTLHLNSDADLPRGATFDRDAPGGITGTQNAIVALFDKLPKPNFEQQVEGTRRFFRELNRLGLTGVVDPGGNNVAPEDYQALFKVWRDKQLTLRIAFALNGQTPGSEFDDIRANTALLPMGLGDDMLRFNGIGERITWAMNNNDHPSDTDKERYSQILVWAASRGMSVTMHWNNDESAEQLLGMWERVNREVPITNLRWSIAHLNNATEPTLRRMKALGVGWTVQDALYFATPQQQKDPATRREPPVMTAKAVGVPTGAGAAAHPGAPLRGPEETPSRADALRLYTLGSAWFSRDETKRGSLEPGKLADLAVLSRDYMTAPVDQIGGIESLLTMVGGRIV